MSLKYGTGVLIIILFLLTGCSSDSASESNFTEALNRYHEENPLYLQLKYVKEFPYKVALNSLNERKVYYLDLFVEANMLDKSLKSEDKSFGILGKKRIEYAVYSLTERGEELFRKRIKKRLLDYASGFIAGRTEVREIIFFSEPSVMGGKTVSEVKYRLNVEMEEEFREDTVLSERIPLVGKIKKDIVPPAKAVLILTDKGWIHRKQF